MRNIDITRILLKEFDYGDEMINFVEDRKGHDFRYSIDFSKIKSELGWKPKHDFEKGIKKTLEWYKNNQWWWKPLKNKIIKDITKK